MITTSPQGLGSVFRSHRSVVPIPFCTIQMVTHMLTSPFQVYNSDSCYSHHAVPLSPQSNCWTLSSLKRAARPTSVSSHPPLPAPSPGRPLSMWVSVHATWVDRTAWSSVTGFCSQHVSKGRAGVFMSGYHSLAWMVHRFCALSSAEGHPQCFHFLAVRNNML